MRKRLLYSRYKKIVEANKAYGQRGSALVYVLVVFLVVMILVGSVATIHTSNLSQAKHQENQVKAYYLALSGIDWMVSALTYYVNDHTESRLYQYYAHHDDSDLIVNETIPIDGDTVSITVTKTTFDSRPMAKIEATGIVSGTSNTYTLTLLMDAQNPYVKYWE